MEWPVRSRTLLLEFRYYLVDFGMYDGCFAMHRFVQAVSPEGVRFLFVGCLKSLLQDSILRSVSAEGLVET